MSVVPLTVRDIQSRIINSVQAAIGQAVPILPKAFVRVLAYVFAGALAIDYKFGAFIGLQLFVATCSDKPVTLNGRTVVPLELWGELMNVRRTPATSARLRIQAQSLGAGADIEAGTHFVGRVNGYTYRSLSTVPVIGAGPIDIDVEAVADPAGNVGVGSSGNLDIGNLVSFAQPVPYMQSDCVVSALLVTAADREPARIYRSRVQTRYRVRPQGGAPADYQLWAEESAGIIRAYPYPTAPNFTTVYCEADPESSGSELGYPTDAQLDAVVQSITYDEDGFATRMPVGAFVRAEPITRKAITVLVNGLVAFDSQAVQDSIEDELRRVVASYEPYIGGLTFERNDRILRDHIAGVVSDVARSAGATYSAVLMQLRPALKGSFEANIVAVNDDASELAGVVSTSGSEISWGGSGDLYVGLRFAAINIPTGSTVDRAILTVQSAGAAGDYVELSLQAEIADDPIAYDAVANNISSRDRSVATVTWVPPAWEADTEYKSPDLAPVLNEVFQNTNWSQGNALSLVLSGTGGGTRRIKTREIGLVEAAVLTIEYTYQSANLQTAMVYTLGEGEKAYLEGVVFS